MNKITKQLVRDIGFGDGRGSVTFSGVVLWRGGGTKIHVLFLWPWYNSEIPLLDIGYRSFSLGRDALY
jgi:hypothetical protein